MARDHALHHLQRYSVVCSGVAFIVERGAIRRPLGLPASGVHDRLPKGWPARSQAVLRATIALRVACRYAFSAAGPPSGLSLCSDRRLQGDEFEGADVGGGSGTADRGRRLSGRSTWGSAFRRRDRAPDRRWPTRCSSPRLSEADGRLTAPALAAMPRQQAANACEVLWLGWRNTGAIRARSTTSHPVPR